MLRYLKIDFALLFKRSKFIWIFSRLILILLFLSVIIGGFNNRKLSDLFVTSLVTLYVFSLIFILFFDFLKKQIHFSVRLFAGIFSVFYALVLSYLLLTIQNDNFGMIAKVGFQIIPLWIILYGIYEILKAKEIFQAKKLETTPDKNVEQ